MKEVLRKKEVEVPDGVINGVHLVGKKVINNQAMIVKFASWTQNRI